MHFIGLAGVPRRYYYSNTAFPMFDGLIEINELVTVFAAIRCNSTSIFYSFNFFMVYIGERMLLKILGDPTH